MKHNVKTIDNAAKGSIELADSVFAIAPREDIMARVVKYQLAKRRSGNHKVKSRSEVTRTTAKMFKQKGTGRARHGAASVVQFRGGGVVHGPVIRDHGHKLPKKVRALGMRSALSAKAAAGKLIIVDEVASDGKTSSLKASLNKLGAENALIIGGATVSDEVARAASNLHLVDVLPQQGLNVYDVLRRDVLVMSKDAVAFIEERLK